MKKENAKPAEAKKTTKKVGRPKGRKSTKKIKPTSNVIDFDSLSSRSIEDDIKDEMEIMRLKEELAKKDEELAAAKEAVDKLSLRLHRREKAFYDCIDICLDQCIFLAEELPWYKRRSKKIMKEASKFRSAFFKAFAEVGLSALIRKFNEELL